MHDRGAGGGACRLCFQGISGSGHEGGSRCCGCCGCRSAAWGTAGMRQQGSRVGKVRGKLHGEWGARGVHQHRPTGGLQHRCRRCPWLHSALAAWTSMHGWEPAGVCVGDRCQAGLGRRDFGAAGCWWNDRLRPMSYGSATSIIHRKSISATLAVFWPEPCLADQAGCLSGGPEFERALHAHTLGST